MKVLSLFDGISCGMLALKRAGIPVENYDAFEIDKYSVMVSKNNFPDIVHHGNVFDGDFTKFKGYDLLLGGSPCTYWSIAKKERETTSDGMGFKLFMEYVRALKESECKYFLYENNYSIHQNIKDEISKYLGVQPIMINSALVSAQNRKRCYWTNIPNVTQPDDLGIMLADVLENAVPWQDKSYCMTSSYNGAVLYNTLERKQRTMVAIPVNTVNGKSHTIPATYYKAGTNLFPDFGSEKNRQKIAVPVGAAQRGRYVDENTTEQCRKIRLYVLLFVSDSTAKADRDNVFIRFVENPSHFPQTAVVGVEKQVYIKSTCLTVTISSEN